ncbi:hypothetical protein P3S67_024095 [Capsicum chacoense]
MGERRLVWWMHQKDCNDCERNRTDVEKGKQDGFLKLQTMGVPDFVISVSSVKEDCENDCLSNCSCTAYSYYTGIGCVHWNRSLIDIQEYSMDGAVDLFIRVAYSELAANDKKGIPVAAIASTVPIGSIHLSFVDIFSGNCWLSTEKGRGNMKHS